jgi:2-polyprenyl-3-methyl-5-hydroxy-6-metoxy-1,4-benzoquinol methylase
MADTRADLAKDFARQILATTQPFLSKPFTELDVLDVGCGYGHTTIELARSCKHVIGVEPSATLFADAERLAASSGLDNVTFRHQGIDELADQDAYDLVVLDNVFEHLPDQPRALSLLSKCMRPGGVLFLLMPNKLWPIEVHYNLPFLSYLPLGLANRYLRFSGRGTDYTDASYAPTYFRLKRLLRARPELRFAFTLPADVRLATKGQSLGYRAGVAALRKLPFLWVISKAFLVVAVKQPGP